MAAWHQIRAAMCVQLGGGLSVRECAGRVLERTRQVTVFAELALGLLGIDHAAPSGSFGVREQSVTPVRM